MSERGNWVVTCMVTGNTFEIFHRESMEMAKKCPVWRVETAAQYLSWIIADMLRRA